MLLPYLEQTPIYNAINFMYNGRGQGDAERGNSTGFMTRINAFLCPSSPVPTQTWWGGKPFAGNNYFASAGSTILWQNGGQQTNGIFQVNGGARGIRDITDGTSNTVAFGEFRTGDYNDGQNSIQDIVGTNNFGLFGASNRNMDVPAANMPLGASALTAALQACAQSWQARSGGYGTNGQRSWNGRMWHVGQYGHAMGNILVPPNSQYPYCQFWDSNSDFDSAGINGLTSFHSGGANVCMADGSVRFLKSSVNWQTLWAIGSRAQGEVVSSDSY